MEIVKLIRFKNTGTKHIDEKTGKEYITKDTVRVEQLGLEVKFGEECELPEHWTRPLRLSNGARKPSPIEQVAPQLRPADPAFEAEWMRVPAAPTPLGQPRAGAVTDDALVAALVSKGVARGVAEGLVRGPSISDEVEKG